MTTGIWPPLKWTEWQKTADTLHMWTQIVGKTRLALSPLQAHWWNVPLYVSARGLNTSAMPYGSEFLEITFDFVSHELKFTMRRVLVCPLLCAPSLLPSSTASISAVWPRWASA